MAAKHKFTDAQLEEAFKKVYKRFRHRANFTGTDIGYRWKGDKKTDEKVVRIHVTAKLPVAEIDPNAVFPAEIDGIPLDVIEGPYVNQKTSGNPRDRAPVLSGGVSIGRAGRGTGTLGAIVIDVDSGKPGILSNWHVMAGPRADYGDTILQPGRADSISGDTIATLTRWMLERDGDAAVAQLNSSRPWLPVQINSGIVFEGARRSRLSEVLHKQGRTTGATSARVDGEGIYRITYEVATGRFEPRDISGFKLVTEKPGNPDDEEVSLGGDSGSVWYSEKDRMAVGLHFAGEQETDPRAERAIACHMPRVLDRLRLRLANIDDLSSAIERLAEEAAASRHRPVALQLTPQPGRPDTPWPGPWWQRRSRLRHDRRRDGFVDPREAADLYSDDLPMPDVPRHSGHDIAIEDAKVDSDLEMWMRLRAALKARNPSVFANVKVGDRMAGYFEGADPAYEVAKEIRASGYFSDIIPPDPYPQGPQFEHCTKFTCICRTLTNLYG